MRSALGEVYFANKMAHFCEKSMTKTTDNETHLTVDFVDEDDAEVSEDGGQN